MQRKTIRPFQQILDLGDQQRILPGKSKTSRQWYRDMAGGEFSVTPQQMRRYRSRYVSDVQIGDMCFFKYDAKHKDTLPYWDAFPLIFPFSNTPDGFMGLNMHYLPLRPRAILMDQLYTIQSDKNYDENTRLMLSYDALKSLSKFDFVKPCIKRYLTKHVRSQFIKINAYEWDMALFLPVADWQKASEQDVWKQSRKIIRGK